MWMETFLFTGRNFQHASISKSEDAGAGKQKMKFLLHTAPIIHVQGFICKLLSLTEE